MINTCRDSWTKYCREPLEQIENFKAAEAEKFVNWVVHHRAEILPCGNFSVNDLKCHNLYFGRPASELIFMRDHDHRSMHKAGANHPFFGKHRSEESRQKISESLKGRPSHKKGKRIPEEVKHKISESLKGKPGWLKGKHHSEETRKKLSEALKGRQFSTETRKKMSESRKGKHRSAETRKKMSEARKGKNLGVHWWSNGISNKRSRECPGEGWNHGRLMLSIS